MTEEIHLPTGDSEQAADSRDKEDALLLKRGNWGVRKKRNSCIQHYTKYTRILQLVAYPLQGITNQPKLLLAICDDGN